MKLNPKQNPKSGGERNQIKANQATARTIHFNTNDTVSNKPSWLRIVAPRFTSRFIRLDRLSLDLGRLLPVRALKFITYFFKPAKMAQYRQFIAREAFQEEFKGNSERRKRARGYLSEKWPRSLQFFTSNEAEAEAEPEENNNNNSLQVTIQVTPVSISISNARKVRWKSVARKNRLLSSLVWLLVLVSIAALTLEEPSRLSLHFTSFSFSSKPTLWPVQVAAASSFTSPLHPSALNSNENGRKQQPVISVKVGKF